MTMKTSLEWQVKRSELAQKIYKMGGKGRDLDRILNNIDTMVAQLGRIEVQIRGRRQGYRQHQEQLELITRTVDELEQMITLAALL